MKRFFLPLIFLGLTFYAQAQHQGKFEQLGTTLPTPNTYRTGSGAPGPQYWQQQADYEITAELDDKTQVLTGTEYITYFNNAPESLNYLWLQIDQNRRAEGSDTYGATTDVLKDTMKTKKLYQLSGAQEYKGGMKIHKVWDENGEPLNFVINKTMMRVDLPDWLKNGESIRFGVEWSYTVNDRMEEKARSGYEFFPEDGNYLYTIAQWFPRMAVYDDVNGWQNKQFLGRGEFALPFGDYKVKITVPADHIVAATGSLVNAENVLSPEHLEKFKEAQNEFEKPVIIVSEAEARKKEKKPNYKEKKTWEFEAENVRDFAFATSRKLIWDAMAVDINGKKPLAMSYYPKEGNPLWEKESTLAVARTLITYSRRTIEYPYPVAISVHTASVGMEYPMICFNFGRPRPDGSYSDNVKWGMIGVIVHEVGHNFFPMIINSDERQWAWMDEGLNTFVQHLTQLEWYPDKPVKRGTPKTVIPYMKGNPAKIRPIMTNSEQIIQLGPNAYSKPSAALVLLRETIMGPELFDYAFKEYSQRWAFKHPTPADFFRTMEDASAVDLDWFWKGWFYSIDHVDVEVDQVRWFKVESEEKSLENKVNRKKSGDLGKENKSEKAKDFDGGFETFALLNSKDYEYLEFKNRIDDEKVRELSSDLNFYEVTLNNVGGLITPVILEFVYADDTREIVRLPAEIWRKNENRITKVFAREKEVTKITFDPFNELADTEIRNNVFPKSEGKSDFQRFKEKKKQ